MFYNTVKFEKVFVNTTVTNSNYSLFCLTSSNRQSISMQFSTIIVNISSAVAGFALISNYTNEMTVNGSNIVCNVISDMFAGLAFV